MSNKIVNLNNRPPRTGGHGFTRGIHLIDIENLCGANHPSRSQVAAARELYLQNVTVAESDLTIIGSAVGNTFNAALGWPGARYLCRNGKDGADIRLAQVIVHEDVTSRFDRAVVASGDGGLAPFVGFMAKHGLDTTVVSLSSHLSREMRLAAHQTIALKPNLEDLA